MNEARILTVPKEETDWERYLAVANEYVALPEIRVRDAAVMSLNALMRSARGLLELTGQPAGDAGRAEPLLAPYLIVDGRPTDLAGVEVELVHHWIPRFRDSFGGLSLTVTYFAPPGRGGLVATLELLNSGPRPLALEAGLFGRMGTTYATAFHRRPLEGTRTVRHYTWTDSLLLEAVPGLPALAMAVKTFPHPARLDFDGDGLWGVRADNISDRLLAYRLGHRLELAAGASERLAFFVSLGSDADGAATAGIDLARVGVDYLWQETVAQLRAMSRKIDDPRLDRRFHQNLYFNYFFARGLTLDTDEVALVTSRSPRYYVSAAHWTRDALLWSLPGLLVADASTAREALATAFDTYTRNPGVHALYLDGGVLYPGFELDELAAFLVALGRYLKATGDRSILGEPRVVQGLCRVEQELKRQRHPRLALYRTFLLPSDDPAQYPYVTYDNALVWAGLQVLAEIRRGDGKEEAARAIEEEASRLKEVLYRYAVVPGTNGPMFAWAFDPDGGHVLYDEPSGSLGLLAHYGFCDTDDPVFRNTVAWIHGAGNPYWISEGPFATPACPHVGHPWILALANDLMAGRDISGTLEKVARAEMDNGYACETIAKDSGELRTGAAFATCAGWLAAGIFESLRHPALRR